MRKHIKSVVDFHELEWDTEYFGVRSAKAILYEPLKISQWDELKSLFNDYEFVSIENRNSEPTNALLIGKATHAFLADVNIQFSKRLDGNHESYQSITIQRALKSDDNILNMADFRYSKFIEDPELNKRGGGQVYHQWLLNSFEKPNKIYALSKNEKNMTDGFLLHSYNDNECRIELVAVSKDATSGGIGTRLFRAVECSAYQNGCEKINVGTQLRNLGAINFYHKMGCKQVGCHQVYHLWNL